MVEGDDEIAGTAAVSAPDAVPADEVLDYGVTPLVVRSGPCAAWITGNDVKARPGCSAIAQSILDEAASVASDLVYRFSGSQFTGSNCGPVTVRPVARYVNGDQQGWSRFAAGGFLTGSSFWNLYGQGYPGVALSYANSDLPSIDLGAYPVTAIDQVVIDGVVIPTNEYRLDDYRNLVRTLPTTQAQPTERWGWPTWQRLDLPLTQEGTFGVTFHFGQAAPVSGLLAAKALGEYLAKRGDPSTAGRTQLPAQTTNVARQGVTVQVARVFAKLSAGESTGIAELDAFLMAYNPSGARRKAEVWSPDIGVTRRMS